MGVIFITHDMGVVAEVADRVLVVSRRQGEEGGSDAVFARPQHAYTRALVGGAAPGPCTARTSPRHFRCCAWTTRSGRAASVGSSPGPCRPALDRAARERPGAEGARPDHHFDITGGILGRCRSVHAVEKVSFDLYPGETLSLVGVRLRQDHHRPFAAAAGQEPGRHHRIRRQEHRRAAAHADAAPAHPVHLPGPLRLAGSAHDGRLLHHGAAADPRRGAQRPRSGCAG